MIQRHTILINPTFSAKTGSVTSSLTTFGGYQVNNVQGLGGGIVNSSNVRGFLNDDVNEFIINDFFSYLTGSTTTVEFAEIYNSDQKLADVFNNYYVSSVLNNQAPSTSVIDNSLTGTSGTTIIENSIYNYNGVAPYRGLNAIPLSIDDSSRELIIYSALTTYTEEDSYYVPVFIIRNNRQMARLKFEACDRKISLLINTGNFSFSGVSNFFGNASPPGRTPSGSNTSGGSNTSPAIPPGEIFSVPIGGDQTSNGRPTGDSQTSDSRPTGDIQVSDSKPAGDDQSKPTSGSTSPVDGGATGGGKVDVGGFLIRQTN